MEAYGQIMGFVGNALKDKYQSVLDSSETKYKRLGNGKISRFVWVCWLQGMENAPELVKVCYESLKGNLIEREVILLTSENIRQYVILPDYIEDKFRKGIIPMAQYTDLLRLELLIKYGGTWMDSTVLCTGFNDSKVQEFKGLDADLFVFQYLENGEYMFRGLSNWFITSCSDNWVLKELRDMLYQYWKDYDCVMHYYIFHLFFGMIMEKHPEEATQMPRYSNAISHYLSRRMGDEYDEQWMDELKKRTCFHKLSYRLDEKAKRKGTFYDVIIRQSKVN